MRGRSLRSRFLATGLGVLLVVSADGCCETPSVSDGGLPDSGGADSGREASAPDVRRDARGLEGAADSSRIDAGGDSRLADAGPDVRWPDGARDTPGGDARGDVRGPDARPDGSVRARAVQVALGERHACALYEDAAVRCWGYNAEGELGTGDNEDRNAPAAVVGLQGKVRSIVAGDTHSCAVLESGALECWGGNRFGQLGNGTKDASSTAGEVTGLGSGVAAVAAGSTHTCALLQSGEVHCWGANKDGQLGTGDQQERLVPAKVGGLAGAARAVAAGGAHTCVLVPGQAGAEAGGLRCWGYNGTGQLGLGDENSRLVPTPLPTLAAGVLEVAAGQQHTCARLADGRVRCWGEGTLGQLGDGQWKRQLYPVDVAGLGVEGRAISTGEGHTCAVVQGGAVRCWGSNLFGQLGDETTAGHGAPVAVHGLDAGVQGVAAGGTHSCAVLERGGLECWGWDYYGQLGDRGQASKRTPVAVHNLSSGVAAIAAGYRFGCAVSSQEPLCWGMNLHGELGNGTANNEETPVPVAGLPARATALSLGTGHACAVLEGGRAFCWGDNSFGQLGDGTTESRTAPVEVRELSPNVTAVAAGGGHSCALLQGGAMKCWGFNYYGQLGNDSTEGAVEPVAVIGLSSGVLAIATGGRHTCAVVGGGKLECWGENVSGQIGDDTDEDRHLPTAVEGMGTGITAVAAGGAHTCALTAASGLKCWGANGNGQLGDGTTEEAFTPVDVQGMATGVVAVSASLERHTCALTRAGAARCWGMNHDGALGDGTEEQRLAPVDVVGLTADVLGVTTGAYHSCALIRGGAVRCWGENSHGQLGDGEAWRPSPVAVAEP